MNSNGNQIWFQTYDGILNQVVSELVATDDGGFAILGYNITLFGETNDLYLLKIDGNGTEMWTKIYGRSYEDTAAALMNTNTGGFYIAALTTQSDGISNTYLIKTDSLGNSTTNSISGNIFYDGNDDCLLDNTDFGLDQWLVQVTKGDIQYSTLTDASGNYSFSVDTGTYELQVPIVSPYWTLCQSDFTHTFATTYDTIVQNIAAQSIIDCPLLDVSIGTPFLRRCFDNTYYVQY